MEKAALALGGLSRELDADDVFIRKLANSSEFVVCDALSVFIRMNTVGNALWHLFIIPVV